MAMKCDLNPSLHNLFSSFFQANKVVHILNQYMKVLTLLSDQESDIQ